MSNFKVHKNDKNRVLLTELLPYEVPIPFSNAGYYEFVKENPQNLPKHISQFLTQNKYTIPFDYKIKKNIQSDRTLSIIHPSTQRKFIDFYSTYESLIIQLCSKSPISLRHPSKVTSSLYVKGLHSNKLKNRDSGVEQEGDTNDSEQNYTSSYFVYDKHNFLYKFYDSYDFHRLEKKFENLLRFDISKCFNNIYTHSITWAVKNKEFAKKNHTESKTFEDKFDKLMQLSNYNETNGIVIGPEVSRIFAEIILQQIDLNSIGRIFAETGLRFNENYTIRRYVDDYFVFSNDDKLSDKILSVFKEELEKYKLYINDAKTIKSTVPLISNITIAKTEFQKLFDDFFKNSIEEVLEIEGTSTGDENEEIENKKYIYKLKHISKPSTFANRFIKDIKCVVKKNDVEYESVTGYCLHIIRKQLFKILNREIKNITEKEEVNRLDRFLFVVLDVMFFIYSMDYRVKTTYIISHIIVSLNRILKDADVELRNNVLKKIADESLFLIRNIINKEEECGVEVLNLLVALKDLGNEYLLENDALIKLLKVRTLTPGSTDYDLKSFNYFKLMVILYYIDNIPKFSALKNELENEVVSRYKDVDVFNKSELMCLFFDFIRCPHVERVKKENLVDNVIKRKIDESVSDRNSIINFISARNWFFDWSDDLKIENILEKKEFNTPY